MWEYDPELAHVETESRCLCPESRMRASVQWEEKGRILTMGILWRLVSFSPDTSLLPCRLSFVVNLLRVESIRRRGQGVPFARLGPIPPATRRETCSLFFSLASMVRRCFVVRGLLQAMPSPDEYGTILFQASPGPGNVAYFLFPPAPNGPPQSLKLSSHIHSPQIRRRHHEQATVTFSPSVKETNVDPFYITW